MRLDTQREAAAAKRKGLMVRTIIGAIWLAINFTAAYLFVGWLFETGELTPGFFWNQLFFPRWIEEEAIRIIAAIVIVVIMNFFVLLGFGFSSPAGRTRPGTPSLKSRNPDPNDKRYDY